MPTGDIYRLSVEGHFAGEPVIFGMGFVSNSGVATFGEDAINLFSDFAHAIGLTDTPSPFMAPLSEHYTVEQVRISDLSPGVSASLTFPVGATGGNTVDDAFGPFMALCVTWRDGLKGKEHRGRTYLTGFAEDAGNAGYWIGEIQTWAINQFAQPVLDAFGPLGTANYSLALVHTVSGGVRLSPPIATPIESYTVHNEARTLRRRGIGVRISRHRTAP